MIYNLITLDKAKPCVSPRVVKEGSNLCIRADFSSFSSLLRYLTTRASYSYDEASGQIRSNSSEDDYLHSFAVLINTFDPDVASGIKSKHSEENSLDCIDLSRQAALVRAHFHHLSPVVIQYFDPEGDGTAWKAACSEAKTRTAGIDPYLRSRLTRVRLWTEVHPIYEHGEHSNEPLPKLPLELNTMQRCKDNVFTETVPLKEYQHFVDLLSKEIPYTDYLKLRKSSFDYSELIHKWGFAAVDLTIDELLHCAYIMIDTSIDILSASYPHLSHLMPKHRLWSFIFHLRDNYRLGNPFHNFRHATDVMQASYFFLSKLKPSTSLFNMFSPLNALLLVVASLGHDIGHPAVTNQFMNKYDVPVAQAFDNQSVLENFHVTQFYQILQVYFPALLGTIENIDCRKVMKEAILATDMSCHFEYLQKAKDTKDPTKMSSSLLVCLLIKAADISNVARPLPISVKWGISLNDEFGELAQLELYLQKKAFKDFSSRDPLLVDRWRSITPETAMEWFPMLANSQLFFINTFGRDFFQTIGSLAPELSFLPATLDQNVTFWEANKVPTSSS
ncbi:BA75_04247T0 [Komagataella pastoris]|uniref:Phosphodiesterase n=1 Tax=Komagataella pastoris TaxID=4922 RepID=A0A1B2JEI3_PICPA|nr:BA75_04247T0 [Komagataella pastoris]